MPLIILVALFISALPASAVVLDPQDWIEVTSLRMGNDSHPKVRLVVSNGKGSIVLREHDLSPGDPQFLRLQDARDIIQSYLLGAKESVTLREPVVDDVLVNQARSLRLRIDEKSRMGFAKTYMQTLEARLHEVKGNLVACLLSTEGQKSASKYEESVQTARAEKLKKYSDQATRLEDLIKEARKRYSDCEQERKYKNEEEELTEGAATS